MKTLEINLITIYSRYQIATDRIPGMESPETHTSRDPVITGENTECSKKPLAEGPSEKCNQADSLEGTVRETCDTVNSVNNLCATLLSNSNTPDTYRYPQGILRKNGIYIPLSTKDTPYILQNGILRIVYMIILTLTTIYVIFHYSMVNTNCILWQINCILT